MISRGGRQTFANPKPVDLPADRLACGGRQTFANPKPVDLPVDLPRAPRQRGVAGRGDARGDAGGRRTDSPTLHRAAQTTTASTQTECGEAKDTQIQELQKQLEEARRFSNEDSKAKDCQIQELQKQVAEAKKSSEAIKASVAAASTQTVPVECASSEVQTSTLETSDRQVQATHDTVSSEMQTSLEVQVEDAICLSGRVDSAFERRDAEVQVENSFEHADAEVQTSAAEEPPAAADEADASSELAAAALALQEAAAKDQELQELRRLSAEQGRLLEEKEARLEAIQSEAAQAASRLAEEAAIQLREQTRMQEREEMIATKVATERREQASRMQEKEELIRALEARLQSSRDQAEKQEAALGQLMTLQTKLSEEQMVNDRQRKTVQRLERELAAAGTSASSAAIPTPSAARSNSQPPSGARSREPVLAAEPMAGRARTSSLPPVAGAIAAASGAAGGQGFAGARARGANCSASSPLLPPLEPGARAQKAKITTFADIGRG